MRIIEYIIELRESRARRIVDIEEIMYWIGRVIGWISIFAIGYAGGSIIRGVLQGLGII